MKPHSPDPEVHFQITPTDAHGFLSSLELRGWFKNFVILFLLGSLYCIVTPKASFAVLCGNTNCQGTCVTLCDNDCNTNTCKIEKLTRPFVAKRGNGQPLSKEKRILREILNSIRIQNAHAIVPNPPGCVDVCDPSPGSCSLNGTVVPDGTGPVIKQNGRCKKCNNGTWVQKPCSNCGQPDADGNGVCGDTASSSSSSYSLSTGSAQTLCTDYRGNPIPCPTSSSASSSISLSNYISNVSFSFSFSFSSSRSSSRSSSSPRSSSSSSKSSTNTNSSATSGTNTSSSASSGGGSPGGGVLANAYCINNCKLYNDTWKNCKPGFVLRTYKHCSGNLGKICVPAKTTKTQYSDPRCGTPMPNRINP